MIQFSCKSIQQDHRTRNKSSSDSSRSINKVDGDSNNFRSDHSIEQNVETAVGNDGEYQLGKLTDGKVRMIGASPDGRFTFARRKLLSKLNGKDYEFFAEAFTKSPAEMSDWSAASRLYGDLYFYPQQVTNIVDPTVDELYPRNERFHLKYTGRAITYNPVTDGVCTLMPENCGKGATVRTAAENYGALSFDPRHGVKAISVKSYGDCFKSNFEKFKDPNGEYLCQNDSLCSVFCPNYGHKLCL